VRLVILAAAAAACAALPRALLLEALWGLLREIPEQPGQESLPM